jgi:hypothetical protein
MFAAVEGHPPYEDQPNALALLATIASSPPPVPRRAGFLTEPIERMLDPDPAARWSMADAAHVLERLRERHARELLREPTTQLTSGAAVVAPGRTPPAPAPADDDVVPPPTPDQRRGRRGPGALLIAALAGLLALAAVVGFLLLQGDPTQSPSASDPAGSPSRHHSASGSTSATSGPSASSTAPSTTASSPPASEPGAVAGASAEQFVRSYYAALPGDTRAGWSALSPQFRKKIGSFDSYDGFWSTISAVTVGRTEPAGGDAVDVSLTYTQGDGSVDREVRRLYLERHGHDYRIVDDAVVG